MRRYVSIFGAFIAAAVAALLLYLFGGDLAALDFTDVKTWQNLTLATACYVLVCVLGGVSWKYFLSCLGHRISTTEATKQVLVSQIGKYLPGNILHFAGRSAMAVSAGVPAAIVATALVFEVTSSAVVALVTSLLAIFMFPDALSELANQLISDNVFPTLLIGVSLGILVSFGLWIFVKRRRKLEILSFNASHFFAGAFLYFVTFIVLGASLFLTIKLFPMEAEPSLPVSISVFAIAWVVGLVTPGAPGGLGVREALITLGLTPFIGGPTALTVSLVHRAISVLGDALAFGIGLLLTRR